MPYQFWRCPLKFFVRPEHELFWWWGCVFWDKDELFWLHALSHAKISNFQGPVFSYKEVGATKVTMVHAHLVQVAEGIGDLLGKVKDLLLSQRPARFHHLARPISSLLSYLRM